jgi:hypothetical protein
MDVLSSPREEGEEDLSQRGSVMQTEAELENDCWRVWSRQLWMRGEQGYNRFWSALIYLLNY